MACHRQSKELRSPRTSRSLRFPSRASLEPVGGIMAVRRSATSGPSRPRATLASGAEAGDRNQRRALARTDRRSRLLRRPSVRERRHRLDRWISRNRGRGLLIGSPPLASHLRALRNREPRHGAAGRLPPRSSFFQHGFAEGPGPRRRPLFPRITHRRLVHPSG